MSRKPPAARMRQIRRKVQRGRPTQPLTTPEPASAEEALAEATPSEDVPTIRIQVGVVEATVTPGPDGEFGTKDDLVDLASVTGEKPTGVPEYDDKMLKDDLKALAVKYDLDDSGTKADIIGRLDEHFGL